MNTNSLSLKSCPFCGGEGKRTSFGVGCYKCGVFFNINGDSDDDIAAWNNRTSYLHDALKEIVEQADKIPKGCSHAGLSATCGLVAGIASFALKTEGKAI